MSDCVHNWCLRKEGPFLRAASDEEKEAHMVEVRRSEKEALSRGALVGWMPLATVRIGVKRSWYCTHCRVLDTTEYLGETW